MAVENRAGISSALRRARARGIKVVTWDADAEPDARDYFVNQATPEGIGEAKRLLHAGPGRGLRDRYEAENVVMRTTLRPEPMPELFARFLAAHAEENGCPAATE